MLPTLNKKEKKDARKEVKLKQKEIAEEQKRIEKEVKLKQKEIAEEQKRIEKEVNETSLKFKEIPEWIVKHINELSSIESVTQSNYTIVKGLIDSNKQNIENLKSIKIYYIKIKKFTEALDVTGEDIDLILKQIIINEKRIELENIPAILNQSILRFEKLDTYAKAACKSLASANTSLKITNFKNKLKDKASHMVEVVTSPVPEVKGNKNADRLKSIAKGLRVTHNVLKNFKDMSINMTLDKLLDESKSINERFVELHKNILEVNKVVTEYVDYLSSDTIMKSKVMGITMGTSLDATNFASSNLLEIYETSLVYFDEYVNSIKKDFEKNINSIKELLEQ